MALDPRNGEILAMVSAPSFNPNLFARRLDAQRLARLVDAPHHPLQNRAIQNTYSPGSVFKIVMATAGLEQGVVHPNDAVSCSGATASSTAPSAAGSTAATAGRPAGARSSTPATSTSTTSARGSASSRSPAIARLGLGAVTGIDLAGEKAGLVPDREWSQRQRGTSGTRARRSRSRSARARC